MGLGSLDSHEDHLVTQINVQYPQEEDHILVDAGKLIMPS